MLSLSRSADLGTVGVGRGLGTKKIWPPSSAGSGRFTCNGTSVILRLHCQPQFGKRESGGNRA